MKLSIEEIKETSIENLLKKMMPTIKKLYNEYADTYNEEQFIETIKKIITKQKNSTKNQNIDLESIIKKELSKKPDQEQEIEIQINEFINRKIITPKDYKQALKELKKINEYINKSQFKLTQKTYIQIVTSNSKLNNMLQTIVEKITSKENKLTLDILINDDITMSLIETYCMLNDISIDYTESELDNTPTTFNSDIISSYLIEIKEYKLLSQEEEIKLFEALHKGDKTARKKLINHNLRLVTSIARRYKNQGLEYMDLIGEGNIGLMTAINKYDETKGYKFSTYAVWWIRQSIVQFIRNKSRNIRIPSNMYTKFNKYQTEKIKLTQELGHEPSITEISKKLDIPIQKIYELEQIYTDTVSIDQKIGDEQDTDLISMIADEKETTEETVIQQIEGEEIRSYLDCLKETEKEIIILRYGIGTDNPMTLEQIAKIKNLTRERIRQIEAKALVKLKRYINKLKEEDNNKTNPRSKMGILRILNSYGTEDEIMQTIDQHLNDYQKQLMEKREGNDLTHPEIKNLIATENRYFFNIIIPKLIRELNKQNSFINQEKNYSYNQIIKNIMQDTENIKNPIVDEIIESLDSKKTAIILLALTYGQQNNSLKYIANCLDIYEQEVINTLNEFLEKYTKKIKQFNIEKDATTAIIQNKIEKTTRQKV